MVFKDKLWVEWMGTIDRFNSAICNLDKEEGVRIDLATMKPVLFIATETGMEKEMNQSKFKKLHGKKAKLSPTTNTIGHLRKWARSSINRILGH